MYALVRERLPGVTIISIGHRPSLRQFHGRRIELSPAPDGPSTLSEAAPA
jgi:putative ATP-binding cassette transporter